METDVHRVAYGSGGADAGGRDASSWVVLGNDGKVRWKNVPQGLHDALTARDDGTPAVPNVHTEYDTAAVRNLAAAPCEVSLGIGDVFHPSPGQGAGLLPLELRRRRIRQA